MCRVSAFAVLQEKYYAEKLEIRRGNDAGRRRVVDAFVEGLHWVLEYYYRCAALAPWLMQTYGRQPLWQPACM